MANPSIRNALNNTAIKNAKTADKPYTTPDGNGLIIGPSEYIRTALPALENTVWTNGLVKEQLIRKFNNWNKLTELCIINNLPFFGFYDEGPKVEYTMPLSSATTVMISNASCIIDLL